MDDDIILHNQAKYEYLNAPCLIEDFKKKYLTALNIYLNDDKFKEKTDSLPILKSSAITKYEKLISKEEAELMKKRKLKLKNKNKLQPLNIKTEIYEILESQRKPQTQIKYDNINNSNNTKIVLRYKEVKVKTNDNFTLYGWLVYLEENKKNRTLLYFHENAGSK